MSTAAEILLVFGFIIIVSTVVFWALGKRWRRR